VIGVTGNGWGTLGWWNDMAGNITLDRIATDTDFDFACIYNNYLTSTEPDLDDLTPFIIDDSQYYSPEQYAELSINSPTSFFCVNCQSLTAHWDSLTSLLCRLSPNSSRKWDVIGLTEIFRLHDYTNYTLTGYHPIISKTRHNSSIGGVGLYVRDTLKIDLSIFIPHVCEIIFIELHISSSNTILVGIIYRPNTQPQADLDIFSISLIDAINVINQEHKQIMILGDLNIDLLKCGTHDKTNNFIEDIFASGLSPLITRPTRITPHTATLIDHAYTNIQNKKISSGIIITDIADHFGIFVTIDKYNIPKAHPTCKRFFNSTNIRHFKALLQNSDFTDILHIECPNIAYDTFLNIYKKHYETAFPLKRITYTKKSIKYDPWITAGLIKSSKTKSKLLNKKLKDPSLYNVCKYKEFCSAFNTIKRKAKLEYYR